LAEFSSVVDALCCAAEVQSAMAKSNGPSPQERRIVFRIGLNIGDVVVEDGHIFGDGVNVAARLEGLAEPGSICVSARVQEDAAGRLDLAFEDMGEQALKNIARPVRAYRVVAAAGSSLKRTNSSPPLPDKPSIAVLPFQNMSGDPEQEYFADGMVEEIITALSRIRWLFVIARNSSFTYKGQTVDVKQVGRELGVRYVLEGSVRKVGGRVRITAQLIDTLSSAHLWADRFDGLLEEVFELQDKVAFTVAGVIESTLQGAEIRRSADRPTTDLTAYDLYLRALPNCYSYDQERIRSALVLLEGTIERDPQFGPALGLAAVCHHHLHRFATADDAPVHAQSARHLARRALQASPGDPGTICNVAFVLSYFGDDMASAITLADRALSLNPSFARGWAVSGYLRLWAGDADIAIEHLETACRLNPHDGNGAYRWGIGLAYFFKRQFDQALVTLLTALEELPSHPDVHRYLAACYAQMGRLDEARRAIEHLKTITAALMPASTPFRDSEQRDLYLAGLRLAMSEEP
jgi:TolB-like protein/Flp pilus assembly protein TadD